MASHKGWDRHFPVKSVARTGGTFNLAKGQLALVDLNAAPTNAGLKIIDDLTGLSKDRQFQLRIGKHEVYNNNSQSSRDWSSETFKVANIIDLKVDAPTEGIITDEMILGYDGFNDASAIVLENGENEEIGVTLSGEVIGALGYQDASVEVKVSLTAPNSGAFTNQELVETAVKQLQNYKLLGNVPLTNYLEVTPVNSGNDALSGLGSPKAFFHLIVEDEGNSNALAAVQAQYNDFQVVRSNRDVGESTYTVITDPAATITATNFVVGQEYEIVTAGTTDFTLIGAADSSVGTRFVATGAGTGTGTAIEIKVGDYVVTKNWKVKGCATCPTGYSAYVDGYVYSVSLEDDGADSTAAVEAISVNVEANSAIRVSMVDGVSTYTVVFTAELTEAEIAAFTGTNPEAVITLVTANAAAVCVPDNSVSYVWSEGESCRQATESYTIIIPDDECGNNILAKLRDAYDDQTISAGTQADCATQYTKTVTTNIVCAQCSNNYYDLFVSEAPDNYGVYTWKAPVKTYDEAAKMGIRFKAKPILLLGSEVYRDDMPAFATSARLQIAGGVYKNVNESFFVGTAGRFSLRIVSIASEPENWGVNLRQFEDITKRYQEGLTRHEGNNYAKWVLGEETLLDANQPYIDYILTVAIKKMAGSFSGSIEEVFNYHFFVAPGAHVDVEAVLNALAGKAGIPTVQAYAKDA